MEGRENYRTKLGFNAGMGAGVKPHRPRGNCAKLRQGRVSPQPLVLLVAAIAAAAATAAAAAAAPPPPPAATAAANLVALLSCLIEIVKAFARILFRTSRLASAKQCCIFWIFRDSPIAARSESQEELPTVTSYTSFHCCGGGVLPAMPEGMRPVVANDWAAIWHRCWLCRRNLLSLSSAWDRTVNFQYADVVPKRLKPLHCGDSRATAQSAQPMPHRPLMILSVSHDSPSSAVHMSFILTHLHRLQLRRRHTALCPA